MLKNFIAEVIHATKKLRGKFLYVDEDAYMKNIHVSDTAYVKTLDVEKIKDNGSVYGVDSDISELVVGPELSVGETPGSGKNANWSGVLGKPARADHIHHIPVPKALTIKSNTNTVLVAYNGTEAKEIELTPDTLGVSPKNHASTTTEYGIGNATKYGHVKLTDTPSNAYGVNSGVAATPKALSGYLPLSGGFMTGAIVTPVNAVGLSIGNRTNVSDDSSIGGIVISNKDARNATTKLSIGNGKNTILSSFEGELSLYVCNEKSYTDTSTGSTVDNSYEPVRKKQIVDYQIEKVLTKTGTWSPSRTGRYRIYMVGGGGKGANGAVKAVGIRDCGLMTDQERDETKIENYATSENGNGGVLPGYGGGGGGIVILDVFVDASAPPYLLEDIVEKDSEGDDVITTVETAVTRFVNFKFSTDKKTITSDDLDVAAGGPFYEDDENKTSIAVYPGVNATNASVSLDHYTNSDGTIVNKYGWYSGSALASKYTEEITKIVNRSPKNSNGEPIDEFGKVISGGLTGLRLVKDGAKPSDIDYSNNQFGVNITWRDAGATPVTGIYDSAVSGQKEDGTFDNTLRSYFIKTGTKWKKYESTGQLIGNISLSDTGMAIYDITGGDCTTSSQFNVWSDGETLIQYLKDIGYSSAGAYLKDCIVNIEQLVLDVGKYVEFVSSQLAFSSYFMHYTYSVPGTGGWVASTLNNVDNAYEFYGGNGDMTQAGDVEGTGSGTSGFALLENNDVCGYDGGIPGGNYWLGTVGGGAASGAVRYIIPKGYDDGATQTYERQGIRSGSGASICIREIGDYCGINESTERVKTKTGGSGYYGGGGGGGGAIVRGNGAGRSQGVYTGGGEGGTGCVIIVYMGHQ